MSITSDLRSYADTAVSQGKQVLDQAQDQLNEVSSTLTNTANEFVGKYRGNVSELTDKATEKATEVVAELRASAEKAVNLDAIKTAVEPYLEQVKSYGQVVTERAEGLLANAKAADPRIAKLVESAESFSNVVVEVVQERVVKPVQSFAGFGSTTASAPVAKPSPVKATRPATKRTTKPAATKPATTKPATARKAAAKRTPSA